VYWSSSHGGPTATEAEQDEGCATDWLRYCSKVLLVGPPEAVLRAFDVDVARPLSGGQKFSWIAGDVVLKPDGGPVYEWLAGRLGALSNEHVRLAMPIRARDGSWTCEGWSATQWLVGDHPDLSRESALIAILDAGRVFHEMVAHLPRAECLDARSDSWAVADRVAWGELRLRVRPEFASTTRRLQSALEPLGCPQVVHADLTGNVLFAAGHAPGVIDVSPYWRPAAYAEGVVVADALAWHGASASVMEATGVSVAAVARALLFRMATTSERVARREAAVDVVDEARRYERAAAAIGL
jgi:uncharacterized protein (TIGR02569 family)